MAKFVPMELLAALHGKVCGHSNVYFAQKGNTHYTGKICNPRTTTPTAGEIEAQNKFKQAHKAALTALSDAATRAEYEAAFTEQKKYTTLHGFVFAQEYRKIN